MLEIDLKLQVVLRLCSVNKSEILRNDLVEDESSECGLNKTCLNLAVDLSGDTDLDHAVERDLVLVICHLSLVDRGEYHALTLIVLYFHCEVVAAEDHILCRNCNRLTVLRLQEVVCRKHEESCLCLSLCRKRYVNSHLVSVEVCVKACADERMELDSTTFYEYRLECLDRKSVECRSTVQKYRMVLNDLF